jgi:hypothetical protein
MVIRPLGQEIFVVAHIAYSLVLMVSGLPAAHHVAMAMTVIRSPRAVQETGPDPEASTCAICAQPIKRTTSIWEHEKTGPAARLPVRHHATPD